MKLTNMNDHEFAAYLRERDAIDNYEIQRDTGLNLWRDNSGEVVAVVVYDNSGLQHWIFVR